jgi:hypothetical protein
MIYKLFTLFRQQRIEENMAKMDERVAKWREVRIIYFQVFYKNLKKFFVFINSFIVILGKTTS